MIGVAPKGEALRRSGAEAGDVLYVTGQLGGSAAEFTAMLTRQKRIPRASPTDDHPQLFPEPRLDVGEALLRRKLATACIDLSDGLSTDLTHLCQASGVSAEIDQAAVPIHPLASKLGEGAALHVALHGGEDYELLFAAPASVMMPTSLAGVSVTRIGSLKKNRSGRPRITLVGPDGTRADLKAGGWEHFSKVTKSQRKRPR